MRDQCAINARSGVINARSMRDQCAINAQSKMRDQCAIVIFFLNKSQIDEREYTNLLVSCRGLALRDPKKACKSVQKACKKRAKRLLVSWLLVSWLPSLGSSWLLASWLLFFSCRLLGMSAFFWSSWLLVS